MSRTQIAHSVRESVVLLALLLILLAQGAPAGGSLFTDEHIDIFADPGASTTKLMLYAEFKSRQLPNCQSWCSSKLVSPLVRYHDWKEKCEWDSCSGCSACAELAAGETVEEVWTASRAVHLTKSGWEARNVIGGYELVGKFPLPSRVDHDACSEHCAQDELCTSATWNCDARCYLRAGAVSYSSSETCTYAWLKPLGDRALPHGGGGNAGSVASGSAQCAGVYVPLYTPGIATTAKALPRPPTVCCNWTGFGADGGPESDQDVIGFGASAMQPMAKAASFFHVLTFMVIGRKQASNVQATSEVLSRLGNVSFFYAHYDDSHRWYAKQAWYQRCSRYHVSYAEKVKSRFVANALTLHGGAWAREFSHIWVIDEDIVVPPTHYVAHFLHEVQRHGALIAQPAIVGSAWELLRPHPRCRTRATDFVELMLPMIQLRVAVEAFSSLYRPEAHTDWGVDVTWCKFAARRFLDSPSCVVVNAGHFSHPKGNSTANYSRGSALEDESCMRAVHAALVSEVKDLACLAEDRFGSLDELVASGAASSGSGVSAALPALLAPTATHLTPTRTHGAGASARGAAARTHPARGLRMYVYSLDELGANGAKCHPEDGGGANNFEWELHVETNLRAIFEVTTDPGSADFYLLPACLNRYWAHGWSWVAKRQKLRSCMSCTARFERKLLDTMRAVGPYFDAHPEKHLVTRHRCPYVGEQTWAIGAGEEVYTTLWRHSKLRYICLETDALPPPGAVRDVHREVHIPYYMNAATMVRPRTQAQRVRDFAFVGSLCCGRGWLKELLRPGEQIELSDHMGGEYNAANATRLLREARFAVEPRGDTPERRNMYEALHAGTPLIFTSSVTPPLRLPGWDGIAVETTVQPWHSDGASVLPMLHSQDVDRAIMNYDQYMVSFEAAREVLMWGSAAFRSRLRLVVTDVFT